MLGYEPQLATQICMSDPEQMECIHRILQEATQVVDDAFEAMAIAMEEGEFLWQLSLNDID